ncbi:energy-coupling factor ABC transporter permease [Streptomyces sp. MUM 178J]|uniref:energy-coupling factor ABC transporter permease n=1 Tax=Streptomyces sp. MUM 178J TaxID=2791991 RepID=UPI001F038865|nr:energy-coupling factor ABC transporter permease [Streptomyces sp. MUM 178J]WRQ82631.1 energy-coupling factor ABC transporter permease [Streptomyces sp. MUM 178J]
MHVPDGFIDAPVSAAAGVAAAGAVAVSLRGSRRELGGDDDRLAPLAGLVAAFVFAVQMLNFPVAAGTSGHLLGGALAAILVGPYTGVLCIAVVLLMQGVLFADGGLTALGVNITVMGVVTVVVAYGLFRGLVRVLPRTRRSVTAASFAAALVSVPASAAAFTLLYAIGGVTEVPVGSVLTAMVGVHVLIGIGEALITMATVGAVLAVRPDLVYGARDLAVPLKLRVGGELIDAARARPASGAAGAAGDAPAVAGPGIRPGSAADGADAPVGTAHGTGAAAASAAPAARPRARTRTFWLSGLVASLVLAGVVSFYASGDPDGLEKVASDKGFDASAEEHAAADSPLADYGVKDVDDARLSGGLAGVIGVGATVAAGTGIFWAVRRRRSAAAGPADVRVPEAR